MTPRHARMTTFARLTASLSFAVGLLAAAPTPAQVTGEQVAGLAEQGRFADLLDALEHTPANGPAADLVADLELYRDHLAARTAARREAFDLAMEEAQQRIEEDKLEEAMVKLIEAHDLADDPTAFLDLERVVALTEAVDQRATAAAEADDWVDALGLYRLLDLLYEDSRRYHEEFLNAGSHVRILQLYNPLLLRDLYKERAERLRDEDDPLLDEAEEEVDEEDLEDWNIKLAGVTRQQMYQALSQATDRHIDRGGYAELMVGALNGLRTLLETEGLETVFPGLANERLVDRMLADIDAKLEDLARPGRRLTRGTATELLEQVLSANGRTVRLPEEVVVYELTSGATGELDPFTTVIWPEDLRQFSRSLSGDFVGVGVQIQRLDGKLVVVTPLEGTPGMEAGIKANDIITRVNGRSTSTWSIDKAVREITGPEGTRVVLTIVRPGVDDPIEMTIVRKKIILESIKGWAHREGGGWDYWVDQEAGLGYIRMTQFLRQTADDMDAAVEQMQREGEIKGLIIDLRFNPGGLLSTAVEVVDRFVPAGRIVSTVDAEGNETNVQNARRRTTYTGDFPVVLLINRGSASASEIVSGALQDYERAFIIGENSYGKGSVQDIFPLGRGEAYFKCTTQHYMLPLGRIIHRTPESDVWGIQPDLAVRMTTGEIADWLEARRDADVLVAAEDIDPDNPRVQPDDILANGMDTQLEAAVLYLKAQQLSNSDDAFAQRDE
ncbi:MAG: S41 family peptidase [Phycisphaerales bacterium JB063]